MGIQKATLAGGCFWCTEAVFQRLKGIHSVKSGYIGGTIKNPAYREICTGRTGHAEAIEVAYDPETISYRQLLYVFFATHDPTTLNRQGADKGTQYRSAIFYHTPEQEQTAREVIEELTEQQIFPNPIVTEITIASEFYEAEEEHRNYYNQHQSQSYCQYVISPKVAKLKAKFADLLQSEPAS